jgi:hypothetical protein
MFNPSTATKKVLDPTMDRCVHFARSWGYDGVAAANPFAYRATSPAELIENKSRAVGPENDSYIGVAAENAGIVIAAYGTPTQRELRSMLDRRISHLRHQKILTPPMYCLGKT